MEIRNTSRHGMIKLKLKLVALIMCICLIPGSLSGCRLAEQIEETVSILMDGELDDDHDPVATNIGNTDEKVIDVEPLPRVDIEP